MIVVVLGCLAVLAVLLAVPSLRHWAFGGSSLFHKLTGASLDPHTAPAPAPVPTPTPTPASNQLTITVSCSPAPQTASLTIDEMSAIAGSISGSVASFNIPSNKAGWAAQLVVSAPGYVDFNQRIGLPMQAGALPDITLVQKPKAPQWTRAQLQDFQGDLMIFAPDIPQPSIYTTGGAHGLDSGWHWTLNLPFYSAADRQRLYDKIKGYGFTHVAIQGCKTAVGGGYHNLFPIADATAADAVDKATAQVHQELLDNGFIPIVAGVAPGPAAQGGAAVNPYLDVNSVLVAMSDWDNTSYAAERIKCISDTFPNAILYYERPGDGARASGIDVSPNVPNSADADIANGGQWLKDMQSQCPRFVGVLYEVNNWDGAATVDACAAEINQAHNGFWRDVQEVRFETNTYQKFWQGGDINDYNDLEAQLQAACPFLKGFMGGGVSHPVVQTAPATTATGAGDLDGNTVQWVGGPNIGSFAQTTKITALHFGPDGIECQFDKRDGANRWPDTAPAGGKEPGIDMGPLEYSLGVCFCINTKWYGSAPIETWNGRNLLGGDCTLQDIGDGSHRGQFAANWFYDARWGALNGYNPKPGEQIGVFVVAGDARNSYCPLAERSNIVLINQPNPGQTVDFTF